MGRARRARRKSRRRKSKMAGTTQAARPAARLRHRAGREGALSELPRQALIAAMVEETHRLPDMLREGLRLVFVGTAASTRSAAVGHYYAHPGNRFWSALHEAGLTPRRYQPGEFEQLLPLGIGFTDLNKSEAGMDHQLTSGAIDVASFRAKIERVRPD